MFSPFNLTRGGILTVVTFAAATVLAGCSAGGSDPDAITIRVALGSSGDAVDQGFYVLKEEYEEKYPGRKIEIIVQDDEIYQTTGLATLLSGRQAPDAYFEWSGPRLRGHVADGDGADISEALQGELFAGRFDENAFNNMDVDGSGIYMVPWTGDVTNVVWYDVDVFNDLGLSVPATWDEYMTVNQTILDAGMLPLIAGNKDIWPVGSIASHIVARMIGEQEYADVMDGKAPMNSPEMVGAFEKLAELAPFVNPSVNALADDEGMTQFFLQKAVTHQIGSWLMADAVENAEDLNFDYFNMPAFTDGKGDQESVLGISTGFMVNAKSKYQQETLEFLALVADEDGTEMWAKAGLAPMTIDPFEGVNADPRTVSLAEMMGTASELVAPADSGHDIEIAAAFYDAAAAVIGKLSTPQQAVDTAQSRIDSAG